jgi:hypothetical protein
MMLFDEDLYRPVADDERLRHVALQMNMELVS